MKVLFVNLRKNKNGYQHESNNDKTLMSKLNQYQLKV